MKKHFMWASPLSLPLFADSLDGNLERCTGAYTSRHAGVYSFGGHKHDVKCTKGFHQERYSSGRQSYLVWKAQGTSTLESSRTSKCFLVSGMQVLWVPVWMQGGLPHI